MYGSETADLVVKYYDEAFGISGGAELAWYLSHARAFGGPVLDLACGTGRLALLLAREGFEVTAIDRSAGMLNLFKEKLNEQPPAISHRIRIENQSMSNFALGASFNTIICCDSFFHNLSVDEEMSCLRRVARHPKMVQQTPRCPRCPRDNDVQITLRAEVLTKDRPKHCKLGNAPALAELGQFILWYS